MKDNEKRKKNGKEYWENEYRERESKRERGRERVVYICIFVYNM